VPWPTATGSQPDREASRGAYPGCWVQMSLRGPRLRIGRDHGPIIHTIGYLWDEKTRTLAYEPAYCRGGRGDLRDLEETIWTLLDLGPGIC
jgi:hypothetical protein